MPSISPAPWRLERFLELMIYDSLDRRIAIVEYERDAPLIVAAPDMLAALYSIINLKDSEGYSSDCANIAQEAIKKAEGK